MSDQPQQPQPEPADLPWKDAIIRVLGKSAEPLHYVDIAAAIREQRLRGVGANPPASVNSTIAASRRDEQNLSPFVRVSRGVYWLRDRQPAGQAQFDAPDNPRDPESSAGLINALGMYWARDKVSWSSTKPKVLGRLATAETTVDFCDQKGVYLLHDGRSIVYVGRTTEQTLGIRLRQHTVDRHEGRWDRFSWFGIYGVNEDGAINAQDPVDVGLNILIATMEALLIEGLEPRQNRKGGDGFRAVEFLQAPDPNIRKEEIVRSVNELLQRL